MTDKSELCNRITAAMKKSLGDRMITEDLDCAMLANFSGLSPDVVYRFMHQVRPPNATTLCLLAKVLRCTLDDLIPPEVYR